MIQTSEEKISCLLFILNRFYYGINNIYVEEIIELADLKSLPNFPKYFSGLLDCRGKTIPVIDVKLALGFQAAPFQSNDVLIIVRSEETLFGMIMPAVHDIKELQTAEEAHFAQFISESLTHTPILSQVAKLKDEIVFILDVPAIAQELNALFEGQTDFQSQISSDQSPISSDTKTSFHSQVPPELVDIFKERAHRIAETIVNVDNSQKTSLTILLLKDRKFAIESEKIKEFCYLTEYAPIPGQSHLMGFMNLRGDILPIADIWHLLHRQSSNFKPLSKVLILDYDEGVIGLVVDEALDVIALDASAFCEMPLSFEATHEPYVKQAVKIDNEIIGVLDVSKVLEALA